MRFKNCSFLLSMYFQTSDSKGWNCQKNNGIGLNGTMHITTYKVSQYPLQRFKRNCPKKSEPTDLISLATSLSRVNIFYYIDIYINLCWIVHWINKQHHTPLVWALHDQKSFSVGLNFSGICCCFFLILQIYCLEICMQVYCHTKKLYDVM